jgi:ubiquilin
MGMGMGGMPLPGMNPQQLAGMMSNPIVQNSIQQMLQNPQLLQALLANNPLAQQLANNPQVAAALQNPDLYRQLSDPATLQMVTQMYNNMFGMGMGMGGMPGYGVGVQPGQQPPSASAPTVSTGSPTNVPANTTGSNPQQPANPFAAINLEPLISSLAQQQAGGTPPVNTTSTPSANTTGTGSTPPSQAGIPPGTTIPPPGSVPQFAGTMPGLGGTMPGLGTWPFFPITPMAQQPVQDPEQRFAVQLQQLNDMGFTNRQLNIQCLLMSNGNVDLAIERMLNG